MCLNSPKLYVCAKLTEAKKEEKKAFNNKNNTHAHTKKPLKNLPKNDVQVKGQKLMCLYFLLLN